jgi:hypothetical protein
VTESIDLALKLRNGVHDILKRNGVESEMARSMICLELSGLFQEIINEVKQRSQRPVNGVLPKDMKK